MTPSHERFPYIVIMMTIIINIVLYRTIVKGDAENEENRGAFSFANAIDRMTSRLDILRHGRHPKTVWERIGKTQFIWKATVINRSSALVSLQ